LPTAIFDTLAPSRTRTDGRAIVSAGLLKRVLPTAFFGQDVVAMAGDDEKTWLLYAETASSLTRLYQHSAQQKRDAYNAGYKAALETVLQFAVKECSDGQTNTVAAATLINFILPQMQREAAMSAAEREGRPAASAPGPTSPFVPHAQHGAQVRAGAVGIGDNGSAHGAMPAASQSAAFLAAPAHFAMQSGGNTSTPGSQPAWLAAPHMVAAYDVDSARHQSGFGFAPPRKRNADATDWMDGGHADGALQLFGELPTDWPVWSKRGRH
jgi:hypothetical protein